MKRVSISTDWGDFTAVVRSGALARLLFPTQMEVRGEPWGWLKRLEELLNLYLSGEPADFSSIPLDLSTATPFQRRVWDEASRIPYGSTVTYGELALIMGIPGGARAVGQALKRNQLPIIIPCHRVVGKGGLTGFSGGLDWKRRLIKLECGG
jgi:methylated-DNA-[protein]-cysteine S-methyltransferase